MVMLCSSILPSELFHIWNISCEFNGVVFHLMLLEQGESAERKRERNRDTEREGYRKGEIHREKVHERKRERERERERERNL